MFDRSEIKKKGHGFLSNNLKTAVLVCLFISVLSGIFNIDFEGQLNEPDSSGYGTYTVKIFSNTGSSAYTVVDNKVDIPAPLKIFTNGITIRMAPYVYLALGIIFVLIRIFFFYPLVIGENRFFIKGAENTEEENRFSTIFTNFRDKNYGHVALTVLIINIKLFLWTLLLIIPGIVKSYQYYFTSYLLAENPDLTQDEAISLSTEMTDGIKFDLFVFDISFILWHLLSILLLGIPYLYVNPYIASSRAYLYLDIKNKRLESAEDDLKSLADTL